MTTDEIIEVLQGIKAGRKWGWESRFSGKLTENEDQSALAVARSIAAGYRVGLLPLPDEITIPARVIPAPLREAPELGAIYFVANPLAANRAVREVWRDDEIDKRVLARGLAFATYDDAGKATEAMCPCVSYCDKR